VLLRVISLFTPASRRFSGTDWIGQHSMAEEVIGTVKEVLKGIIENVNAPKNESAPGEKKPSTPEGMAVAYSSLVVMAMLPIIFGSIRSVKLHKLKKVCGADSARKLH